MGEKNKGTRAREGRGRGKSKKKEEKGEKKTKIKWAIGLEESSLNEKKKRGTKEKERRKCHPNIKRGTTANTEREGQKMVI